MFNRGRYVKCEYNWSISCSINRLIRTFTIIALIASANTFAEWNCADYDTCRKCVGTLAACRWSFDKQTCVASEQNRSAEQLPDAGALCPEYTATMSKLKDTDTHYSMTIKVSNGTAHIKRFLHGKTIACQVENRMYAAALADDDTIVCKSVAEIRDDEAATVNEMSIFHYSIVVDGVRLRFDHARDHYMAYHSVRCPNTTCASAYWEKEENRYYCKWCVTNAGCGVHRQQSKCDARNGTNNIRFLTHTWDVNSPEVTVVSFQPSAAQWGGRKTVNVTVKNHWILAENRSVYVTVAGRPCRHVRTLSDESVECTLAEKQTAYLSRGPVEVVYASGTNNYTVRSDGVFSFVNPVVTNVSPNCGPAKGGTLIDITGEYLNVTADVQVSVAKDVACKVVTAERNRISCVTGNSYALKSSKIKLVFDDTLVKLGPAFKYVDNPRVLSEQTFAGIVSGGVQLSVRGEFSCVQNPEMYVELDGDRHYGACTVVGSTQMFCRTPKLNDTNARPLPPDVPIGFQTRWDGQLMDFSPIIRDAYLLQPDPVFIDFIVDGIAIVINGMFLYREYQQNDVRIRVGRSDEECVVRIIVEHSIVCHTKHLLSEDDLFEIVINVGENLESVLKKRCCSAKSRPSRLVHVLSCMAIVSVFVTMVAGLLFCMKTIMTNSKRNTQKRYMEELKNIAAGIEE